ncbi:glycosyltransferase family 2 protein [Paenibacillus abyssi]|uniref:Glycosyl transferase n=1 Tax=Paenibacillus abyssi TaxID=1340531 RepID=A0A917CV45_9BACL|nr:glycosyltransferase family 2 protein [Paenibacillus abyssi]GGF98712.1 glycosyl transferase [Paenibacillus abyssi]
MKKTSIIISTYNGKELLKDCIYTIKRHTEEPYEIIVVDNGSTDGTADICRQEQITFISLASNAGFPKACNMGLKIASGDTLLLLNNDVLVSKNWLKNMLDCLYSRKNIGIVGPLTNYASGRQQIDMPFTSLEDMANQLNEPDPGKWLKVDRIVGFCFLFKRELLEKIGLLDERFSPGHYEDDDYCFRARNAGYRMMIAGDVFVFHHGSASFGQQDEQEVKQLIERNRQMFIDKWGIDPAIYIN